MLTRCYCNLVLLVTLWPADIQASKLEIDEVPPAVVLEQDAGGLVDGSPWRSHVLRDRVQLLFYVDPSKNELNESFVAALAARKYSDQKFASTVVINMAATWLPNRLINLRLRQRQEAYPKTTYVRDNNKKLVNAWGLSDKDYVVLVFAVDGGLLLHRNGEISEEETKQILHLIDEAIANVKPS